MASIQSLGIGSGLLTSELVDDIIATEREPVEARLDVEQEFVEAKISAYGEIVAAVSDFGSSVQTLALPSTFSSSTSTSSNETSVTATTSSVSIAGSYSVQVDSLAQNHSLASAAYDSVDEIVGSGTLTFRFGEISFDGQDDYVGFAVNPDASTSSLTIDSTNNTLSGIRDAINEEDFGIQASIVDDGSGFRLLFTAEEGGLDNSIEVLASGDAGIRALNYNLSSEQATLVAQTSAGSVDISAGGGLDSADLGFTITYNSVDLEVSIANDVQVDTAAELLVAVQSALDSALVANGFEGGAVVAENVNDRLRLSSLAEGFSTTLELQVDGTVAQIEGATALSDGYDFAADNATFSLSIDGGSATAITLNQATLSRQGTVDLLNQEFLTAGISGQVVAKLNDDDEIVFAGVSSGSGASIEVSALDVTGTAASVELGLSAGTDSGLDGFGLDPSEGEVSGSTRLIQTAASQDASFSVNGLQVRRNSNLVAGVISGTTLNLKAVTSDPVNITISRDSTQLVEDIQGFVDNYNALKLLSQELTAFDPDAGTNGQGSLLIGDSTLRSVVSSIGSLLRSTVTGLTGNVRSLAEIGITTNQHDNFKLQFDTAEFQQRYEQSPEDILALFANAGSTQDSQVSFVSAGTDTQAGVYGLQVESLATVGTFQGLPSAGLALGNIVIDEDNDEFTVSLNGLSADIQLTQDTYASADDLAYQIQSQVNSASLFEQAGHSVSVVYNGDAQRFDVASNQYGSDSEILITDAEDGLVNTLGFALPDQGPFQGNQLGSLATATGQSSENFSTAVVLDSETSFELSIGGTSTGLLTIPGSSGSPTTYNTPDDLITAIATQISSDESFAAQPAQINATGTLVAGQDFSADNRAFSISVDGGDTVVDLIVDGDASTVSFGGEAIGSIENSLAAVQAAIDASALNTVVTAQLSASNTLILRTSTTGDGSSIDLSEDGSGARFTGSVVLDANGFDFSSNTVNFDIAIDGEAPLSISMNQSSSSREETVQFVQDALDQAGIGTRVTASLNASDQLQLHRSSDSGASTAIALSGADANALSALGLADQTVNGLDGFGLPVTTASGRDEIVVDIDYAMDVESGLARFTFSSQDNSQLIEFDNISANAGSALGVFIGDGSLTTSIAGLDVSGKINGVEANGSGQYLTAASGNTPAKPGFYLNSAHGNLASSTLADSFVVTVDGVSSSSITLGTILDSNSQSVASQLQSAINNNAQILSAGVSVTVEYDPSTQGFGIISTTTGLTSSVAISQLSGSAGELFGFVTGRGEKGEQGSNASGSPDPSAGIRLLVSGGSIGLRGEISYVKGVSDQLDGLLDSFLANDGILNNRTAALTKELESIADDRLSLNSRIEASEQRLRASFLANDLIISSLNTTADFLTSQLSLLEGLYSSNSSGDK